MNPEFKWNGIVLDAKDPKALMEFYGKMLGLGMAVEWETFYALERPAGMPSLGAQLVPTYQRPVWPPQEGKPDQGAHLDIQVSDLAAGVARAEELGAVKASEQFIEGLTVMIDPEGHPFCLFEGGPED